MVLKQMEVGPMANFVYLIGCPRTHEAAVVDPAWEVDRILRAAAKDGFEVRHVLLTHAHPDHANGVEEILEQTKARLYMHKDEIPWEGDWKSRAETTEDGTMIHVGDVRVLCLHTPGHSRGSQCFLAGSALISGDTLFVGGCGRTDLPGGEPARLYESLTRKIAELPGETIVYPGHDYGGRPTSTVADEKRTNPYLRFRDLDEFLSVVSPGSGR